MISCVIFIDRHRVHIHDRSADHHHHDNHCYRRSRDRTDHYDNGNHVVGALRQRRNKRSRSSRRSRSREKPRSRENRDFPPSHSSHPSLSRMDASEEHSRSVSSERDKNKSTSRSFSNGQRKKHFPAPMFPVVPFHVSLNLEANKIGDPKKVVKDTLKECIPSIKSVAFPFLSQLDVHVAFESVTDIPLSFISTNVHAFDYFRLDHFDIHEFNQASKNVVSPYGFESLLSHFQHLDTSQLKKYCLNDLVGCCNMIQCKYVHLETKLEKDHIRRRIMNADCPNGVGCTRYICHIKHPISISPIESIQENSIKQHTSHSAIHDVEKPRVSDFKPLSSFKSTTENLAPKYVVDAVYSFIIGRKDSIIKQDALKELCSILPQAIPFVQHSFTEFFDNNKDLFKLFTDPKSSQLLIQALPRKRNIASSQLSSAVVSFSSLPSSSSYINNIDDTLDADLQSEEKKQNEKSYSSLSSLSSLSSSSKSTFGTGSVLAPLESNGSYKPKSSTSNKEYQIKDEVDALLAGYASFDSSWNPRCVSSHHPPIGSSAADHPVLLSSASTANDISKPNSDTFINSQHNNNQTNSDISSHLSVQESKLMDVENITTKETDNQKPIQHFDCLLCNRRFKSQEALKYHEEYSDLHFQNIRLQQNQ